MKVKEDKIETLADTIVFSYLNFAKWIQQILLT